MIGLKQALAELPLIAILRGLKPAEAVEVGEALVSAGFTILEVPLNSPEPVASIGKLVEAFGDRILIGAGTVLSADAVQSVRGAGGRLIVMPHTDASLIAAARGEGLAVVPGFQTPSEAFQALAAGAGALKLFPAEAASPAVVKALTAVLPREVPLLAVGGITPERMERYWTAGAAGFGVGSALYRPGKPVADVRRDAEAFVSAAKRLKHW